MASKTLAIRKLVANLRDNSKLHCNKLQCGALTYISSNAEELEKTSALSEEEYSEICGIVMNMITSAHQNTREEAAKALHTIVKCFKNHDLKFFQSALQINRNKRLQIFQFLDNVEDTLLAAAAQDPTTVKFMYNCLHAVQSNTMEWLLPTACTDSLQTLTQAENRTLSEDEEVEEMMINYTLALLQRLYKIALIGADAQSVHRFSALVIDKVVTLAYMGHKRQRGPAIKVLYQAVGTDLAKHVKTKYSDAWIRYKNDLQGSYSTRMALLVKACELDWASQWSISIQLLGTDLHRGAMLINNLLSVEERAFKSTDTTVRRQAFVSWQLLVDNFALDMKELATTRRIKLLCVPLTAKNSKSELIALTKLEVWWYLITKLYPSILKFADPVITQFLNFCFGPLGDTPLLSAKVDVIASPGKRFYKTKLVAVDALLQLIVQKQEDRKAFPSSLDEKLPHPIVDELFKECYKAFLHSVGEAIIIICQLHETEITNREEVIKVLLKNLMRYVRSTSAESKIAVYNELILVVTELLNRSLEVSCVLDFVRDDIVTDLSTVAADLIYRDKTLMDLMSKIMMPSVLMTVQKKHCDPIACLIRQAVKPKTQTQFHPETLKFLDTTLQQLESVATDASGFNDCFELWFAYAEIACKYMMGYQDINEGTAMVPRFKTIESIIRFPFAHMYCVNSIEAQRIAVHWKDLYKQFECQADVISTVKPNEIIDDTSKAIGECLVKNEKCYRIVAHCLEALLGTINYKFLLAQNKIPSIVRLVADVTRIALHESRHAEAECALKALSSLLITVYGHSPDKALSYMKDTSQTIELMLKIDAEDNLVKEITSTWETIVSILRGLHTMLDANFLLSYKDTFSLAIRHANSEIASQALSVLEMKDNVKEDAKAILVELAQEVKKSSAKKDIKIKSDKIISSSKHVKITGSFLNRKIPSPRPCIGIAKPKEKEEKKLIPMPPEPDSQDYVVIRSDVKLEVNRLTEHQKESLKRRRDDIPALYNDLSQSSSQDTQDLQQWFDGKVKRTEAPNALPDEKKVNRVVAVADENPDKENKIDKPGDSAREEKVSEETVTKNIVVPKMSEDKTAMPVSTPETIGTSGQDPSNVFETIGEPVESIAQQTSSPKENKESQPEEPTLCPVLSPLSDHSYVGPRKSHDDSPSNEEPSEPIAKKLNFESREEYPDEKDKEADDNVPSEATAGGKGNRGRRSNKNSTSGVEDANILQSAMRTRLRNNGKPSATGRELKNSNTESQDIPATAIAVRGRGPGRPRGSRTQYHVPAADRGTKRKAASDSESEGSERDKRRRKNSRSPSITPTDTESAPTHTDKRTESEMSRLRIDMVFDGPLPSRRRSKVNDEIVSAESLGKRQHSPEIKGTRAKSGETRSGDNLRRSYRGQEKEGISNSDVVKKRRRKGTKLDAESKGETQREEEECQSTSVKTSARGKSKRSLQDSAASESQIIVDDEEAADGCVAPNVEPEKSVDAASNVSAINSVIPTGRVPTPDISEHPVTDTTEVPADSDLDEVVESSQDSSSAARNNKKSIAKLAKLNSIDDTDQQTETMDCAADIKHPRASSPINPSADRTEPGAAGKITPVDEKSTHDDSDETFLDISAIRPQLAEDVPTDDAEQQEAPEESKTSASATSAKASEPSFNLSSPKNLSKRYSKPKGFAPQGRTAHMLGLVTKLAVLEKDGQADRSDEEFVTVKKNKSRDTENETPVGKRDRSAVVKDSERMGSPGGSRQEKIFNNMKAADYAASPPGKLFGNLKNDGEKVSPKMDKPAFDATNLNSDVSAGNDHDGTAASSNERDELPILEWSSANPPSLTASPSASILKCNRPVVPEMETDVATPNKAQRKRVSFADPPVSKEMGYEIATGTSPLKPSKYTTFRGLLGRKDSPMRIRQSRFKMIQIDTERAGKDDEPMRLGSNEMDMECERENELLLKIAEDLEETVESRTRDNIEGAPVDNIPAIVETRSAETKTGANAETKEDITPEDAREEAEKWNATVEPVTTETQTQDDMFNSSDDKFENPKESKNHSIDAATEESTTSSQNSTLESFKLNVTDDSVVGSITNLSREERNRSDCLEDTVDARNLTSLNLTENPDEIFRERPVRTSDRGATSVAEMDTLPVTDSLLATQDSQGSTQPNIELAQPELLNSTDPVYPALIDSREPIETIIESLTNPLWIKNLSKYFATRSLRTIGDLARLSEREVVRIPVKGSSKVDFVRRVLGRYEEKLRASAPKASSAMKDAKAIDYLTLSSDNDATLDIAEVMDIDDTLKDIQKLPIDFSTLDATVAISQIEHTQNESICVEDLDPHARYTIRRTSTSNSISTITLDPSSCSVPEDTASLSQTSTILLSSDTYPTTKVSVATSTDSLRKPLSKSVGSQTTLEELLDEVDAKLVLESAVKRSSAETLLEQYKQKMGHMSESELGTETIRMLLTDGKTTYAEATLKAACRTYGLSKLLARLPEVFWSDKQFYAKVLAAYCKGFKARDCIDSMNFEEVKNEICKKCSPTELSEMLSRVLKEEERQDVKTSVTELSNLDAMLKRMPMDLIISHTVENDQLIPSSVVLDVALRNNGVDVVTEAIESKYPAISDNIFEKKMTHEAVISHIEDNSMIRDKLLSLHRAVCDKLSPEDLLDAYREAMSRKLKESSKKR